MRSFFRFELIPGRAVGQLTRSNTLKRSAKAEPTKNTEPCGVELIPGTQLDN